jgi:tetratricopeptide (TPR) repeat protein
LWLAAPVVGAEQAVPHVIRAAETCFDTLAHEEAERQLRRGLDLLADTPASAGRSTAELAIRLRLGSLLVQLRGTGTQEAWACFARARELAEELGDRPALLAAHRSLYEVAFARADHRTAGHLAEAMLNTAQRSDDRAALVVSHLLLGRTLWSQGRLSAARQHLERGLQASGTDQSQEFLPPRVVLQLQLAAVLAPLGEPEAANRLLAAAVEEAQGSSPFAHAIATAGAALVAALARDLPAARRWAVETLDLAERWRMVTPGGYAAVVLSWVDALSGSPAGAITDMRRHLDQIEAGGAQHLLAWGLGLLAEAHLHDGRPSEALRLLDDALVRVDQTGERLYESELHRLRALSLLELDPPRRDEARSALRRAVGVAREQGSGVLQQRASDSGAAAGLGAQSGSESHPGPRP